MSKLYINMTLSGYVSASALATFAAALSPDLDVPGLTTSMGAAASIKGSAAQDVQPEVNTAAGAGEPEASDNPGMVDAAGTPFDATRHTGSIVKSGLWRMKTGLSRPESEGEGSANYVNPNSAAAVKPAAVTVPAATDEEDEFAAFTAAAAEPAATATKARTWADADLSKLTNQAAQKLGSADVIKAKIAEFVPTGETPHSRNIPADKREAFAQAVEAAAGIEYVG